MNEKELFSQEFEKIYNTGILDDLLRHIPNKHIRKVYALLRIKGFSEYESKKYIVELVNEL